MNTIRIYIAILTSALLCSCQKNDVDNPGFGVVPSALECNVGDTIRFNFKGSPNFISFYSGERGYRYQYRDRTAASGKTSLQFTSALNAGVQPNSLHLMVSQNFKGVPVFDTAGTVANIAAASWTDITSRAVLATNATAVPSGNIDLTDFAIAGKPVYIAFKYTANSGSIQNKWTVTGLNVTNTLPDESVYTIANLAATTTAITSNYGGVTTFSPGWFAFPVSNQYNWAVSAGTSLVITGATTTAAASASAEAWAIMGPLNLQKVTPDIGIGVKSLNEVVVPYAYGFTKAGTYNATFVGANQTANDAKQEIKQFTITVR